MADKLNLNKRVVVLSREEQRLQTDKESVYSNIQNMQQLVKLLGTIIKTFQITSIPRRKFFK